MSALTEADVRAIVRDEIDAHASALEILRPRPVDVDRLKKTFREAVERGHILLVEHHVPTQDPQARAEGADGQGDCARLCDCQLGEVVGLRSLNEVPPHFSDEGLKDGIEVTHAVDPTTHRPAPAAGSPDS